MIRVLRNCRNEKKNDEEELLMMGVKRISKIKPGAFSRLMGVVEG